jgi:hypothetical protein
MIPSSVYSTIVIQYNSYQEFRLRLHYINGTPESIWRGSLVGYSCCRTYFRTITVYSIASSDFSTHIHHGCLNPTFAQCGGEAQHLEKLEVWSPPGLPNVQSSTARPKTPRVGVFLVSLERS